MIHHYRMFADYNRWANRRVYDACAELSEAEFRADKGAFFGSLHGTLNHILAGDRVWLRRFTGAGPSPKALDEIQGEDFARLRALREAEDERIIAWLDTLTEAELNAEITYSTLTMPGGVTQALSPLLAHFFNHQTHHRGQAHTILTISGKPSLVLDLVYFQRTDGRHWV